MVIDVGCPSFIIQSCIDSTTKVSVIICDSILRCSSNHGSMYLVEHSLMPSQIVIQNYLSATHRHEREGEHVSASTTSHYISHPLRKAIHAQHFARTCPSRMDRGSSDSAYCRPLAPSGAVCDHPHPMGVLAHQRLLLADLLLVAGPPMTNLIS